MNIKKHIPNIITCGNLFCGCLAIVSAFEGDLVVSAYLVGIAAVLDFFDGFAARLLKVGGELGKQLDSLADMVTFGVVPGVVLYELIKFSIGFHFSDEAILALNKQQGGINFMGNFISTPFLPYIAFLVTIFSAVRLAKFN
ncbi:MAG: CDP-alcohol phosphatidyltransferase family protein, partial [Bacteroidia bacterium]